MAKARKQQPQTPFADLLPPLGTEERNALAASIQAEGVRDPVVVDEEGNVLDGHHRLKVDPKAPQRVIRGLSPAEKQAYVFQANFHRRNLTHEQKRELLKAMKTIAFALRDEDKKKNTQERVAMLLGVAQNTVSVWFSNIKDDNAKPDARIKINPKAKPLIALRVQEGESLAQVAADVGVSPGRISQIVKAEQKATEQKEERQKAVRQLGEDILGIRHADFRETKEILDDSIDFVFTDPPYGKEHVGLYLDLAAFAKRVLRPGSWCVAYSGQAFLPNVLKYMERHLTYGWCFAVRHTGGDLRYRKFRLQNGWKPLVAFYKPPLEIWWDWFADVISGGKEKDEHDWQQAEAEAAHFIKALSPENGIVCDPMCGSGTSCVAAKRLGRQWVGIEKEQQTAEDARLRIARMQNDNALA